jgi:putative transposase
MPGATCHRAYDHRMRDLVCEERDPDLSHHLGVPRSTAISWIRRGPRPVVSAEVLTLDQAELQAEVLALRRRIRFLLAIIDNLSRRILAWRLAARLEPQTTCQLLTEAAKDLPADAAGATVVADSGLENVNAVVDSLFGLGQLRRVLAQVEITFSNSMIEAWWRSLKHGWLYLHELESFAGLQRLIAFYVEQHNTVLPHAAFAGQTPEEMYFGRGNMVSGELATAHARARNARMASNRALSCDSCRAADARSGPISSAFSEVLQLHRENSRMS